MMVLNHGKPVLCEKPLGMNYAESKEMIDFGKTERSIPYGGTRVIMLFFRGP